MVLTRDMNNAKDLLQDLAVKVFSKVEFYQDKTENDIDRLLTFNLKNLHISKWRKIKNYSFIELTESKQVVQNDVWEQMQKKELQAALAEISKKDGICFRLRIDGFSPKEIALKLSTDNITISQRILRAKNNLIKKLAA